MSTTMAAVDLGASSGRVIFGTLSDGRIDLSEVARFRNGAVGVPHPGGLRHYWDILQLWDSVTDGLRAVSHDFGPLASVGIDTWAVDYGLLDRQGDLISNPASYRCSRTDGAIERFYEHLSAAELYARVGLQELQINTIFQLVAEDPRLLKLADSLLLIPDLLGYWLTGDQVAEVTNASTTGLLDPRTRSWRSDVCQLLESCFGRPVARLLPRLVEPGEVIGSINTPGLGLTDATGNPTPLIAVGSHDTASAVVAVPAERDDFCYISCGTWSLVGLELPNPIITAEARAANLTNELGVDGTVRFLKNVMGLWVLNECLRTWRSQRLDVSVADLVRESTAVPALRSVFDINDTAFFSPGDMPSRVQETCRETGEPIPQTPAEITRCVLDSLALAYRKTIRQCAEIANREVSVIHMVGGGVQNELLCQLTANATGLPVVAGPIEGTALGNLVVQARTLGALEGGLPELRQVVRASSALTTYQPEASSEKAWNDAEARL